jgi:hypothetical protein
VKGRIGAAAAQFLESHGILRQAGIARSIPCERCRVGMREIIDIGGDYHAVCESGAAQCPDMMITQEDAAALAFDMTALSRAVGTALGLQGRPEPVRDIGGVHRLGTTLSAPGLRHPVFFANRSTVHDYVEALGTLIARQKGAPFALLLVTSRFFSGDLERLAREHGVIVLALAEIVMVENDRFAAVDDVQRLLTGLGATRSSALETKTAVVGRAYLCDGTSRPAWRDLDDLQYGELLAEARRYDVFADQRTRCIWKSGVIAHERVPESHFRTINAALLARAHYDPNIEGPDKTSGKQIFQRARAEFDLKTGKKSGWRLFKSIQNEDEHVVYSFQPDAGLAFVFVFLPEE